MNDSDPSNPGKEAAKHTQGEDYFKDPVWRKGELPVRKELGAGTAGHDDESDTGIRKVGESAK